MELLGKKVVSTQNIIHNAEFPHTNYSPNLKSDRKSGSFVPQAEDHGGPLLVRAPSIEFRALKLLASVRTSVGAEGIGVLLIWRFQHEPSLNHTTSSERMPSLRVRVLYP
jgi:hypothetical protein